MANWVEGHFGNANTQYNNTFIPDNANRYTGNQIMLKGGRRGRRGGSLSGILATAATPGVLLALQNQYGKKNIYKSKYSRRKRRRTRSSRRRY
jgi:hypothetical protein